MYLKSVISIFLLISPFIEASHVAAEVSDARWEAVFEMTPAQIAATPDDSEELSSAMQTLGIAASLEEGKLKLAGTQDLEQLRNMLFDDVAWPVNFLGGPVELALALPAGDGPVTLRMQTRPGTGYRWEVQEHSESGYAQDGESVTEMLYPGPGAPAIQTIQLQSRGAGTSAVRLIYRRTFERDAPIQTRVNLRLAHTGGLIELTDPTPAEPKSNATGKLSGTTDAYADLLPKALPASYDARTLGIVPDVRDQGGCGSCWAFGTVGVMEIAIKKNGGSLTDLSEQFLISCNKDDWGCDGGLTASKYHYNTLGIAQTVAGAVLEADKPYTQTEGTCTQAYAHPYKASGWQFLTGSEWTMPSNDKIKNAIYTYGAVTAGVCVDDGWDFYDSGVYTSDSNVCNGSTNHQIDLVGWDDATGSWILRNSWGPDWGESGYMRIAYDPTGSTSRVGEGASWIKYTGSTPATLKTYAPAGDTYTNKPTYSWSRIATATSYKLKVKDVAAGTYPINGVTVSSTYCNATTDRCSYTPTTALIYNKKYQWQVAAGTGTYTALQSFVPKQGFVSQFNGNATGWVVRPGAAWVKGATSYYTDGLSESASSVSYNKTFGNFTYQAKVKRAGASSGYPAGLVVRGTPTFGGNNDWLNAYQFLYSNWGDFSVWKGINGTWTPLKDWTDSAKIVKGGWNTLKVVADGDQFRFSINGTVVWTGSDTALKTGQVGLWMYREGTAERFQSDWATLSMSEWYKDVEEPVEKSQIKLTNRRDRFGRSLH